MVADLTTSDMCQASNEEINLSLSLSLTLYNRGLHCIKSPSPRMVADAVIDFQETIPPVSFFTISYTLVVTQTV